MVLEGDAKKLKVIVGEADIVYRRPLYEAILFAAKKYRMAGVTIYKGVLSYGADSISNHIKVFSTSDELPMIIEMIDRAERVYDFSEIVSKLMDKAKSGGIVFVESVDVVAYKKSVE